MLNGAAPAFDLAAGGIGLPIVRSLAVAALFSASGTLLFQTVVTPRAFAKAPLDRVAAADRMLRRLARISLLAAGIALLAWLLLEAAVMADAGTLAQLGTALPKALRETGFGHVILLQLASVLATALILGLGDGPRRRRVAAAAACLATVLQAGHSHAYSMADGSFWPLLSVVVHLAGGAAWLGGLVPLLLTIHRMPAAVGAAACRWFSSLGKLALVALVPTASYQGYVLAGGFIGLVGSAYGWVELAKLLLLVVLTGFAVLNRYRLAPSLGGRDPAQAKRTIILSICLQTGVGILVLVAAGLLSSLPPGMHLEPVWPFTLRPSLVTLTEDPDLHGEVVGAGLGLAASVLAFIAGWRIRRVRWFGVAGGVVLAVFAAPHLSPLLVEAYPTSFYRSPTGFAATAIVAGQVLYPAHCARCHGADGAGNGPDAAKLPIPPADLTAGHLWAHDDGELFWWLSHGIDAPEGGLAMPGFADTLTDDQLWALIDYLRAYNAGVARQASGAWTIPVAAPGFRARCPDGRNVSLEELRGGVVVLRFEQSGISVQAGDHAPCQTGDRAAGTAYAVVSGLSGGVPSGTEILIDANGWLRDIGDETDPALPGRRREIEVYPLPAAGSASPHHHHAIGN